jgi:ribonuclease E
VTAESNGESDSSSESSSEQSSASSQADYQPRVTAPVEHAPVETAAPRYEAPREAPQVTREPEAQPLPEPITTEPVVSADPSKPKKGGWWAKAKASLGN